MGLLLEQANNFATEAEDLAHVTGPLENQNPNLCGEAGISDFCY